MKLIALFSGGKDSSLAVQRALEEGYNVTTLLTVTPENPESYMFHFPNTSLTKLQSEAAEIPIVNVESKGVKEEEVNDIEKALRPLSDHADGLVVGAIASKYQAERIQGICDRLSLQMFAPLWHNDPKDMWLEMIAKGFCIMIVGVACQGLGKVWLGRVIDEKALAELEKLSRKHSFHLGGEGGEFETLTLDAPFFKKRLVIKDANTTWEEDSGSFHIKRAELKAK